MGVVSIAQSIKFIGESNSIRVYSVPVENFIFIINFINFVVIQKQLRFNLNVLDKSRVY